MLKLVDIVKEYKIEKTESVFALKNVSIEFRRNEFVSILGPSGCGKTTLLNIVGGLDRYTSGDIQVEGVSTTQYDDVDWDTYRNRRIGFVFQSYNLIPHLTILKNVALSLTLAGVDGEERKQRALEALRKVGLEEQARKKPNQLSGGQMQRVAIARALVNNPEIILADEPTGALDTESGLQVMDLLKEVARDRLVIMVTHNPQLAEEYSTRIVYLRDGEVVGDTMPYNSETEPDGELSGDERAAKRTDDAALEETAREQTSVEPLSDGETEVPASEQTAQDVSAPENETAHAEEVEHAEDSALEEEELELVAIEPDEEQTEGEETKLVAETAGTGSDVATADESAGTSANAVVSEEASEADANKAEAGQGAQVKESGKPKKPKKRMSLLEKLRKIRKMDRSAMKLGTAISLSWTNLISKKGRTLLTSIAGSIGIIGIILVLALSNGARLYIDNLEESALSSYPITVNKTSMSVTELLSKMMNSMAQKDDSFDEETIKVQEVLGNLVEEFLTMMKGAQNDLHSFKQYVDKNFDSSLASVKYNYGTAFNCYIQDPGKKEEAKHRYMKVNPYTETMQTVVDGLLDSEIGSMLGGLTFNIMGTQLDFESAINALAGMLGSSWGEMSSNVELIKSQYELVGERSKWPESANEVVIVVDENNRLMDFQLFMLGLQSQDEVKDSMLSGEEFAKKEYSVDRLLELQYKVMNNVDYLDLVESGDPEEGPWIMTARTNQDPEYVDAHCVKFDNGEDFVKVSGIVRPKPNTVGSSIQGIIGYTPQLSQFLSRKAMEHPAIKRINQLFEEAGTDPGYYLSPIAFYSDPGGVPDKGQGLDVEIGDEIEFIDENEEGEFVVSHETNHFTLLRQLGLPDTEYPQSIEFYCSSFEAKHGVEDFIAQYIASENKNLTYSDGLSSMMGFIDTMATTITGVLVAFAAISLIVSTIMIAIIIYTSVLERRKEIGVLRSIGARKKDISRVFLAESGILGGYSGVIGVIVSFLISLGGSAILKVVFGIEGLMSVTWWHCLLMLGISVLLSMLAGFIPSRIAANKDPAIALRSE